MAKRAVLKEPKVNGHAPRERMQLETVHDENGHAKIVDGRASNGAKSKYDPKTFPKTAQFLAIRGAIQSEIADCFGVSTRTLQYWLNEYPELAAAIKAGNDVFNPRVERALAEKAIGFFMDVEEVKVHEGVPIRYTVRKYFPPDTTAAIFFLKNRVPEKWRDVQEHYHSGELRSADSVLEDIQAKLVEFQKDGYLTLPAPKRMKEINPRE